MSRVILRDEMVEVPDEEGAYYKVDIRLRSDGHYICTIPEMGRCIVAKELPRYAYQSEPFAWKIVYVYPNQSRLYERTLPH